MSSLFHWLPFHTWRGLLGMVVEVFYWDGCDILGGPHVWHIAWIYSIILLYLGISLKGEVVGTLLAILRGVYWFIQWSFYIVKTLIHSYFLGFFSFCWRFRTYYFGVWLLYLAHSSMELVSLGFTYVDWLHASPRLLFIFGGWQ